ncbi:MAG: acyl-CoA-binding protein [Gammaproteobacteria bacterium]|nr:acyl-CoA-binding protein [Gammaproteobacteria bacterium]
MSLTEEFQASVDRMNASSATPGSQDMLKLYGLFKQSKFGDTSDKRPGMTKIRERAKFDAWAGNSGTSKDDAMRKYMDLVDTLAK